MIRSAYLRVYVPLEQGRDWTEAERAKSIRSRVPTAVGDYFLWNETLRDDAFVAEWEGTTYACPRFPKLRMLEGVLAFPRAFPRIGALMSPDKVVQNAAGDLELIKAESPLARSHILTAPWHVPLRWFAAFSPEERELLNEGDGPTIRYRASQGAAVRRLYRAIEVLDTVGFEDAVIEPVRDLVSWLEGFDADHLVELDYGTVPALFSDGDIAFDESCEEVNASIDALENGNFEKAGTAYAAVAGRWAQAQALAYVN